MDGVWGHSKQLLLNQFFDQSTTSMRKVDDGEEKKEKKRREKKGKIMTFIVATNIVASRLLERRLVPISEFEPIHHTIRTNTKYKY